MRRKLSLLLTLVLVFSLICGSTIFAETDTTEMESADAQETAEETVAEETESGDAQETEEETTEDDASSESADEQETAENSSSYGAVTDSGSCGDDVTWTLYEDGTLVISGSGAMTNYTVEDESTTPPWVMDYYESVTSIVIEEGVTSIGDYAFIQLFSATSVSIASTVTSIGDYAFANSWSLSGALVIPSSVSSIGEYAFCNCFGLTSVEIQGACAIGEYAFMECGELTYLSVAAGSTIGAYAFRNTGLDPTDSSQVSLGEGVTYDETAFAVFACELIDVDGGTVIFEVTFVPSGAHVTISEDDGETWLDEGDDYTWSYDEETGYVTISLTDEYMDSLEEGTYSYSFMVNINDNEAKGSSVEITISHTTDDETDPDDTESTEETEDTEDAEEEETGDTADAEETEDTEDAEDSASVDAVQTGDAGVTLYLVLLAAAGCALIAGMTKIRRRG